MRHGARFAWATLVCLVPTMATANGSRPLPLETQLLRADLVVVGRLGPQTTCLLANRPYPCAEISTDVVLKGSREAPGMRRYILFHTGIMELSIQHVRISENALFFLARIPPPAAREDGQAEFYRAVQGPYSVLPITPDEFGTRIR